MLALFGCPGTMEHLEESSFFSLLVLAFTVWMLIECYRNDPERYLWLWIIFFVPFIGPLAYFFVRWLPNRSFRTPGWMRRMTRGAEIRRLHSAARQIGNPYHYVQLGDALRETGQFEPAGDAYARALEKEPGNLAALWGAGMVDVHCRSFDAARAAFEKVLQEDPQYKFGDASLAYAKSLISLQRREEATSHLEKHVKRWRQPEGICLLAQLHAPASPYEEARYHLEAMLAEIDGSPLAIAREPRRPGRQLRRKTGTAHKRMVS